MLEIAAAVNAAEEIDKAVGIVAKLIGQLKAKPDLAAQKLAQALGEVGKTLQVVETATSEFLSLGIDEGALAKGSKLLLDIDAGKLRTEVERGRGHCHLIWQIHRMYLDKWFQRIFAPSDYASISNVFKNLSGADGSIFDILTGVASTLETEAGEALTLVVNDKESEARARILAALPVLRPLRKTMSKTMQTLYSMQAEFVDIAGAV